MRRVARYAGVAAFAIACYLVALKQSFPYRRLADRLVQEATAHSGYQVRFGEVEPSWGAGVTFTDVVVRKAAADPEDKAGELRVPEATVSLGLFAAVRGDADVRVEADLLGGEVEVRVRERGEAREVSFDVSEIALERVALLRDALGVPLRGALALRGTIAAEGGRASRADGSLELSCRDCAVGDGKSQIRLPSGAGAFGGHGVTLPVLRLGEVRGAATVANGVARIDRFEAHSPDLQGTLAGEVALREPPGASTVDAYLRFAFSDDLVKREPKFEVIAAGMAAARREDGTIGVRISGRLDALRFVPSREGPEDDSERARSGRTRRGGRAARESAADRLREAREAREAARRERPGAADLLVEPAPPPARPPEEPLVPEVQATRTAPAEPPPGEGEGEGERPPVSPFDPAEEGDPGEGGGDGE